MWVEEPAVGAMGSWNQLRNIQYTDMAFRYSMD